MRKTFLTLAAIFAFTLASQAQKKSGAIQYETQIDPVAAAEATGMQLSEQMKARMPRSIKANYELLFNATNASYMPVEETEDSNGGGRSGMGRMMMRFGGLGGGDRQYYYTFADNQLAEVFDLMDTTYVMPGKLKVQAASIGMNRNDPNSAVQFSSEPAAVEVTKTGETKKIIGFDCQKTLVKITRKATILGAPKDVVEEISLWQTNELGFNFSPDPNYWTEGTVLAIEKKGGGITATSAEYRKISVKDVTAPKKANPITEEQYKEKMEAMRKRFSDMRGQGSGRPMRISIN
jgi:hypothetical protein